MGVMERYNDKKKKKDSNEEKNTTSGVMGRYEKYEYYNSIDTSSVDQKYIDSFMKDSNTFLTTAEKDYGGMGWGNASSTYDSRNTSWQDLSTRADTVSAWLYKNRSKIDEETYKSLNSYLDSFRSNGSSVLDTFKSATDYYSQWATEDEYNKWYQGESEYQKNFENVDVTKASQGWQKYIADTETAKNALKHDLNNDGKEAWWEKALGYLAGDGGGVVDTTLPNAGVTQTVHDLRADESYRRPNDDWTEEQKNAFGQLYEVSPTLAFDFAEETNKRNSKAKEEEALKKIAESATSGFWAGFGHTAGAIATTPFGLADYLSDLAMSNAGRPITTDGNVSPFEYSQAVTGGITEHLNKEYGTLGGGIPILGDKGLGDLYGLGTSIAQSMASAYTLGGVGTLVSYFGQGAASGMQDALERGATDGQAAVYGTALGVFEGLAEMVGVDNLFSLGSTATVKGFIKNILSQAGAEGIEEGLTSLLSNIADNAIMQDKSNFNFTVAQYMAQGMSESEAKKKAWMDSVEGIAFDTIAGAVSGGVSGGIHTTAQTIASNIDAKKVYGNGADLVTEALDIDPNNAYAQKMQTKVDNGKALSGGQINRLVETNEQNLKTQDTAKIKSAVETRLTELGETGDISSLADVIVKAQSGEKLTTAERAVLTESKYGRRVSTEMNPQSIESGEYASAWAEKIGTERINAEAYNKGLYDLATEKAGVAVAEEKPSVTKNAPTNEIAIESKFEVSEDGKTRIGDTEVTIKEIASIKNGEITLRLDDDTTVNASDVEYGSSAEGLLYENVVDMGLNATTANAFINGYDGNMPVAEYALGFRQAYRYGELGIPKSEMNSEGFPMLSESVKDLAYNHGAIDAKYKATEKQSVKTKVASATNTDKKATKGKKKGKLHNTLTPTNETQRASLKTLGYLAEALNIDIYTFESATDAMGRHIGSNGWYDPSDNSIHLDLYAGADGKGTMLFTAAHELTHHIREKLHSKFKAFADFLFEQYGEKGISVSELIESKRAFLEEKGRITPDMTEAQAYDLAYEEVVADACESFLADGDAVQKIAELKAKDKTLWQTIKDFLTKLVARIKAAYEGLSPDSVEGKLVAEMLDSAEQLRAMWTEMLVEASELENAVAEVIESDAKPISTEEIITDGAVVTDGNGNKYSIRSMKHDIKEGQMFRDLMTYCDFTKEQVGELRRQLEDLVKYMTPYRDIVDLNEKYGIEGRRFSPYKPNSDPLYTISLDFSTQCSKRLLTQYVIEKLQLRENRPMSPEEQMAIRDMLKEYGKVEKGLQVACVMCYVEAARLKAPKQIQKWLDDPATAMRNFFADKNPEFSAYIKKAQEDIKESRGYPRNASKKEMRELNKTSGAKDVTALNKIRPKVRAEYKPSAEEMAIIETASKLPNSTYLTAGNLANLSETHPDIYKAYTAFIRTATRSKALETDEPYYYGDSTRDNGNGIIVSDSFIEAVNRENGMRFSSWSDWRIQHLLDWITAVIDNSVRGAAMHGYTKYGDEVRVLGKTGMMFNLSGVAGTQTGLNEDGSLSFSETESVDIDEAIELREEFPETAGLQCIGVGVDHIFALLRSDIIDYVIPYHTSGLNATLRRMGDIYGWKDFTQTQHATEDKSIKKEDAVDPEHWHQEPIFSEFFVGYDTGLGGIEAMQKSAENYKRMCRERGLIPKFNEFAKEPNYWKLLIDRKMVNQKTNTLIKQRAVTPDFDFDVIKGIVDKYVANYDSGLEERAFNHIVENWDNIPKRIRDLKKQGGTKAKKTKKAVDTLANETIAVQPKEIKNSDRVSNKELAEMDDTALYIKNTNKANYIGMIFNGTKTEETRSRRTLDAFIGKDFYVTDGKYVYGSIVLGEPHKYTAEEFHKIENQKKHRVPKGDEYDVKPGGTKWAYPIESYNKFDKPQKLSDSKEYKNSFQARQVLYSDRDIKYSIRKEAPPKKTEKAYKLMRLVDGKLYPLFIGNNEKVSVGTWYNADSPNLSQLKNLAPGTHLVDMKTGEAMTWDEYAEKYVPKKNGKPKRSKPNVEDVHWANDNGYRFMHIEEKAGGKSEGIMQKQYGDTRAYYNWGVNGSSKTESGEGSASLYALRPGWHFGEVPSMHQIGYDGEEGNTVRLDNQVWVEVEMSADVDYNAEAASNWGGDIPTHIPTNGYYKFATNPTQKKTKGGNSEADLTKADWYVAGAFKVNRILSDSEADSIVENYNKANGKNVPLDYRRNYGRVFNAETMRIEDSVKYSDRVLMGSLFSGGGTLEAGLAYQMLDKEFGVEYDGKIASVYADNHGDHIQVGRVEDFDISKYDDIFYLHASPVCHNFSKAKHGAKELQMDIDSAKATAKHLETSMPQVFTVENAPGYRKSQSLKIITDKLTELGYKWDVDVYNSADYGSATSRNRVILRAVKDGELPAKPTKQERTNSWDKVTRDLWDTLPKSYLRPSFISAIENTPKLPILDADGKVNVNKPLLILTTTSGHMVTYCWEGEICPTLTTKCGEAKLVMPDGNIYAVTPEFMGRIQGLPDDYKYPKAKTRAFTIIGNGIPTHLTKAVVGGVLDSAYEQTHDGKVLYSDRGKTESVEVTFKGKPFWIAMVNQRTGNIEATWTYEEAESEGFDLNIYEDVMEEDGYVFFTTELLQDNDRIEYDDYGNRLPDRLIEKINKQIEVKHKYARNNPYAKYGMSKGEGIYHTLKYLAYLEGDTEVVEEEPTSGETVADMDDYPFNEHFDENYTFDDWLNGRFSDRDPNSFSNRSLLANALESVAQNDVERNKLKEYKGKIALIESEQVKLAETRAKIKELSFAKGQRDNETLKKLQFEANQSANRINTYDKQLLSLESTKALKGVLDREKAMAYKRAEQKGKEALKEQRAKDRDRNLKTQRELMNRYQESRKKNAEGRKKTELRYKIKKITSELDTLLRNPTSKKHIKEELRKEVANALDAFNMDTVGAEERLAEIKRKLQTERDPYKIEHLLESYNRISLQGEKLADRLNDLHRAYEKIKATEDIELNLAYQEVIRNSIEAVSNEVGDTSIRNMTLEQLDMVYDLFKMIRQTIRNANKAFKANKGLTIMQMAEAVNDQVRTVGGQPYKHNVISDWLQREGWHLLKPYVAFRTIGSVTLTNLYKELRNGEDTFYNDVKEAQAFIEEQYEKHGYKSWDMKKTETFTAKSGKTFDLTLEQRMTLYAYYRREKAHKHIIEGGIVFEDALITEKNKWGVPIKYKVTTKDAFNLSEETFAEIATSLTDEQKAFVDAMQRYLSVTMGAKGNEVSMELLGVKLFKEEFYLPIKSSKYYMNFSAEEAGEVKLKSPAFSKETVPHANNPIVLHNFTDLWAEHINDMSMYHSFVLALEDFTRVYNYKTKTDAKVETMDTKATIETAYPGATAYISKFLKDLNGGVRGETVGWAEKLTSLSKKGAVLGSASVAIQQPSAVMRAMAYVNPKHFAMTTHKSINLAKHNEDMAELKKYAPIAGIKEMGKFDVGMGQGTVDWIKSNKTAMDYVDDFVGAAPEFMDEITWVAIWNAVKRETVHNRKDLRPNSEEFLKVAGERFTEVISLSQVYDSVFSRSDLMRNKSLVAKWITSFMAEPSTTLNMLWDAYIQGKRTGSKKGFVKVTSKATSAIVASIVLNSALKAIVMAGRDDDEDESYWEKYLEHFFGDLKDNLNPLTLIPVVKDVLSIFDGYDVERMDMSLISDLKKAMDAFNSDNKTAYEKWSGLIGAISAMFGVPVKNVERDVRAVINTFFGDAEATTKAGITNAIVEGWTGESKSNSQQLYEAMLNGDTEQIERVKGRFKDQSDINSAIRSALRENDPRIKEAAEARYNGNISEYMKIAKEIIAEGHFKQDDIVAAINSEINALKKGEGTTESSSTSNKVTSIYKVDDYYAAIVGRDQATAYVVKEDLIKTDVANGKDRDEAEADFNSKFASHLRELYEDGEITTYEASNMLVNYGGKSEEDAYSKVQYWEFKKKYPDYELSEEAVKKYYSEVEPSGINIHVYYTYSKQSAKCKGTDSNGDGRADSGTKKAQILAVINSLPITSSQKDVLYYLNGWSASTLWEAPWH